MTKYTLPRLEEAIGQLEALQKGVVDMSQYSWIGEILYDLRIVADEIKEDATTLEVQIKSKENVHRD